jgi:RHS repeat-associated protein
MAPELALVHSSGAGNSPFGTGWSLTGFPAIGIDTRYHVPRWDGSDGYQFGNDELVPWMEHASGGWRPRGFVSGNWSVAFYRSRRGSAQTRVEKWVDSNSGRVHFRTRDAANCVTVYGARPNAAGRICDVGDESRTFLWLPELVVDPKGNVLWFDYAPETLDGVDRKQPFERLAPALTQRYLKRIHYANAAPLALSDSLAAGVLPSGTQWLLQVVLDYGDHADPRIPSPSPDQQWLVRVDPYSSYACGFEVRTYRLCRRILCFHQFPELGSTPRLTQAMALGYREDPAGSTLEELTVTGIRWDAGVATTAKLPSLRMTYSPSATDVAFSEVARSSTTNAPGGISTPGFNLVDLYGEGSPGLLYQSERSWYYKSNLGGGQFAEQVVVASAPAVSSPGFASGDFDADGNTELALLGTRSAGAYELDRETLNWRLFHPFGNFPHVESLLSRARWIDLNGDRRPDAVIAHQDRFTWFASDGDTFLPPVDVPNPAGMNSIPTLADDTQLNLMFADMTGDGLADLVCVQPGRVVYWPALGNGRFAEAVVMDGAPEFASAERFDPARLRLVDLDGSGTTDFIYLAHGEVHCWINACGNRFVPGPKLSSMPYFDDSSSVRVLDILGDGRPCLVWSCALPARETPLEYLSLAPAVRPRLLTQVDDSMGGVTKLQYSSSATHYHRDLQSGRGWVTRMPGHHPVVDSRTITDQISGTESVTRFEYHDGFYDGREREQRGFGHVDIYDAAFQQQAGGAAPVALPALKRRWFHIGTDRPAQSAPPECYGADAQLPIVPAHVVESAAFTVSAEDVDDGLRALNGKLIRSEAYAIAADGTVNANPFEVVQKQYRLRALHPRQPGMRPAVSQSLAQTVTYTYEQHAADPRVTHELIIQTDEYEEPTRIAQICYPRRAGVSPDSSAQTRFGIRLEDRTRTAFDESQRYEFGIPVEMRTCELAGLRPQGGALLRPEQFNDPAVQAALAAPGRHDLDVLDDPNVGPRARIIAREQTFYWDDRQSQVLPLGQVGSVTLLHHEEAACFEPQSVTDIFGAKASATLLTQLGYAQRQGYWWQADETFNYLSAANFRRIASFTRSDGASTRFQYDPYWLLEVAQTDALNNTVTAEIDYCELAPWRVTDPNGTRTEVRYDALGVITAFTTYGQMAGQPWGFDALASVTPMSPTSVNDAIANAAKFLQGGKQFVWYDVNAWSQSGIPTPVVTLARESLVHDGTGAAATPAGDIQIGVAYLDGSGRPLQEKLRVEGGLAIIRDSAGAVTVNAQGEPVQQATDPRWRASGHVVYDAKQRPTRVYEPFFSGTPAYEADAVLETFGVATLTQYDAMDRVLRRDFPNGTFESCVYNSWSTERADANDNVVGSAYEAVRKVLSPGSAEMQAYQEALPHASTLTIDYFDGLGRVCAHRDQGGTTASDRFTQVTHNLEGCQTGVIDPRGLTAFTARFDMQRRPVYQRSIDQGEHWRLPDAYGRDTHAWDGRNFALVHTFDLLDRHISTDVTGGDGPVPLNHRIEEWIYGETLANRAAAVAGNLLGRVAITHDGAQAMTVVQCDPAGQVVNIKRQLRAQVDVEPDWRGTVPLEGDVYSESAVLDAQGRPIKETLVDGTIRAYTYARSGAVVRLVVTTPDGTVNAVPVLNDATFNARAQPLSATFGNGASLQFTYDPLSYRVATQTASRAGMTFQKIGYTYDPVGNVVRVTDAAQEQPNAMIAGIAVPARRDYAYDAHYRIRQATGRVHQALLQNDYVPDAAGAFKGTRRANLNDGAAIERFTRSYDFDGSGNLLWVKHVGTGRNWTTNFWISQTSNRSMSALDLNGNPVANPEAQFDGAGNICALPHLRSITWNWRNQIARAVAILRPGGTDDAERYFYGADGKRVRRLTTRVVAGGGVEVTEKAYFHDLERKRITVNGKVTLERWTAFLGDGELRIANLHRWTVDSAAREVDHVPNAHIHYQLTTHQASVAIELDEAGALISYEEYFPYGGTSFLAGDNLREIGLKDYRYGGKECDDFTGLYNYGHRYYAPWMGRWLSPDPAGPDDDWNLYQFVLGNPVTNSDRDGLDTPQRKRSDEATVSTAAFSDLDRDSPQVQLLIQAYRRLSPQDAAKMEQDGYRMIWRDLDRPEAGAIVVSERDYQKLWRPKHLAWAKAHHINVVVADATAQPDRSDPSKRSNSDSLAPRRRHERRAKKANPSNSSSGTGASLGGADKTSTSAAGANTHEAKSPGVENGDGSGTVGTHKKGAIDQGDGEVGTGSGRIGTGPGGGGKEATPDEVPLGSPDGSEEGIGLEAGQGTDPSGSLVKGPGSELGDERGTDRGVLGGDEAGSGDVMGGQGDAPPQTTPQAGNSSSGADINSKLRGRDLAQTPPQSSDAEVRQSGSGRRGRPEGGSKRPGGTNGHPLSATEAWRPKPNADNAARRGSGSNVTGSTGAASTVLRILGYLNLEFGGDKDPGQAGGVPGGKGKHGGLFAQIVYGIVTIINTINMIRSIVKSVARGVLARLLNLVRSPRALLRGLTNFLKTELPAAWKKLWSNRGDKPFMRTVKFVARLFWDARRGSLGSLRNKTFWLKPRLFGGLERVGGSALYDWEHIVAKDWVQKNFPRLMPLANSYLNSWLRLPASFNRSIQNFVIPKLIFYAGVERAVRLSAMLGWSIGEKVNEELATENN